MSDDKIYIPEVLEPGRSYRQKDPDTSPQFRIGCAAFGLSYFLLMAAGLGIYIWTIVIAYQALGVVGAVLSAVFPFFAQIFWVIKIWTDTGSPVNPYCLIVIGYSVIATLARIGSKLFFFRKRR